MNKPSIIAVLMLAILVGSTIPAFAIINNPHIADAMWFDDFANYTYNFTASAPPVGFKFNVTVAMNFTEDVFAYQAVIRYNRTQLKGTAFYVTAPPTSAYFAGHATTVAGGIDSGAFGNGTVAVSEACSGSDFIPGPKADTLFKAEFQILIVPAKGQKLSSVFNITGTYATTDTYVWDKTSTPLAFTPIDAYYEYAWAPPTTKPFMGIEGPSAWPLVYGPGPAVGQTFDVKVYVKQIDPAWYLNNVTFTLSWNNTVIDDLGAPGANFTLAPDWTVITNTFGAGTWTFVANYTGTAPPLANKVLVATLHFTVMTQQVSPPAPSSAFDESYLTFSSVSFFDHTLAITANTPEQGHVIVGAFVVLKLPWLQVDPLTTIIGPAPSIGTTFNVGVDVKNLTKTWNTVGIQFRLQYDDAILQLVNTAEGPFMTKPTWDLYGTFFTSVNNVGGDGTYPGITHVIFFDLLFPNTTSGLYDQPTFPNAPLTPTPETPGVNPTVAIFTFKVLQQNCFDSANITTALNILPMWPPHDDNFVDKDANYINDLGTVNGTVVIEALNQVDRQIDLVGGSVNDGYGVLPGTWPFPYPYVMGGPTPSYLAFPTPYGGQGPNHSMDQVFPQSQIYLNAYVTYNYWPVQSKDVGFEIEGPFTKLPNGTLVPAQTYQIWAKLTATSDTNGVASLTYRMPWPCLNPDSITGVWKITSTVTIADQVVSDTMLFYYQRLVYITSVTTDSYSYTHGQCIKVTVNYSTHSQQVYPALFSIVIEDNLTVPFGFAMYSTTVGGAVFCTWKNSTFSLYICIPKWAYAGNGSVLVSVYDKDPTIGGEAIAPEYTPIPIINIYPY